MNANALHALVLEDDLASRKALARLLVRAGYRVDQLATLDEARRSLDKSPPDLLVLDLDLPDGNGIELLEHPAAASTPILVVTGDDTLQSAVEAMRRGACDYFTKPIAVPRLRRRLKELVGTLATGAEEGRGPGGMTGKTKVMRQVFRMIQKVAPTEATVLITGASGTGKERVAQAIHGLSRRRHKPLIPVNCGAVSPALIESQLFGHEKGSFTGAHRSRRGFFEQARGGTLFLDEVTEMPLELQVKLLRVLETGTLQRLGGEKVIQIDARLVAATNRDPMEAVKKGKLREDLYYRLNVFPIHLPSLRERRDDVPLLAQELLAEINRREGTQKSLSEEVVAALQTHEWPGNVRELTNVLRSAHILAEGTDIQVACLPGTLQAGSNGSSAPVARDEEDRVTIPIGSSLREAERDLILATLEKVEGNKTQATKMLGVSLKTLYNRLHSYGDLPEAARWLNQRGT